MTFQIKDLKNLLSSLETTNICQMTMKSHQFELIINTSELLTNPIKHIKKKKHDNNTLISHAKNINKANSTNQTNSKLHKPLSTTDLESYSTIISPMVGTFYRSPAPNESPFVEKYDCVEKKQTVCIIEAMKLMNEIEAEVNGEIVEILVKDGDIVDCGQALMKVKSSSI